MGLGLSPEGSDAGYGSVGLRRLTAASRELLTTTCVIVTPHKYILVSKLIGIRRTRLRGAIVKEEKCTQVSVRTAAKAGVCGVDMQLHAS